MPRPRSTMGLPQLTTLKLTSLCQLQFVSSVACHCVLGLSLSRILATTQETPEEFKPVAPIVESQPSEQKPAEAKVFEPEPVAAPKPETTTSERMCKIFGRYIHKLTSQTATPAPTEAKKDVPAGEQHRIWYSNMVLT